MSIPPRPGAARLHAYYVVVSRDFNMKQPLAGVATMEFIGFLALLVFWFLLQAWVLPRFGVRT